MTISGASLIYTEHHPPIPQEFLPPDDYDESQSLGRATEKTRVQRIGSFYWQQSPGLTSQVR